MQRLAWIEILDRHGDVAMRHPVYAWPLRMGRAYSSDIVLDDPYVAADHLEIDQAGDSAYQLKVVNSINAMTIGTLRGKQSHATVSADQTIRIGQTQFRIRPLDYAVSAEKPLPRNAWSRTWPALFGGLTILLLLDLLTLWLNYSRADGYNILLLPIVGTILMLFAWASVWALIGRVLSGRANFIAHTVIASLAVALLIFEGLLCGYVDFAFNTNLVSRILPEIVGPLVIGTLLYRHIGLVSRMSRRKTGMIVATLLACLIGFGIVTDKLTADEKIAEMFFSGTLGPPSMLLARGESVDAFIASADRLKSKVDEEGKAKPANPDIK